MPDKKKVAVIGGGLGGISAAACLAAAGFRVALYEKNDKLGGKLNVASIEGFSFDLGPSIIILPQYFRRVFERAGRNMDDYVELQELAPHWRSFFEDGVTVDLHPDMARMERELERLGASTEGYWSYMEYSRRLFKFSEAGYLNRPADSAWDIARGFGLREMWRGTDFLHSMHGGLARYIDEPHLQHMLGFFIKYVGSSPYDAPGTMNLLAYSQMGYGLFYVKGGMYNLARGYQKLLEDLGVEIHVNAEVSRIDKDGDRVRGISLANGDHVSADVVVSNMEVIPAYRKLLSEDAKTLRRLEKRFEPACSGLVVHLGVKRKYPQLQHHNFFFSADPERFLHQIHRRKELPDDPTIYLVCPTRTDEALAPPGHEIIKILPHIPYIQDSPYSPSDYAALKERVLDKLERMGLEGLREGVVVQDVLTPDDLQRMYYSNRGSIYGVVSSWKKNLALKAPKRSGSYKNLYFVGGSVNPGGGTCMVVLSGVQVADLVMEDLGTP
jgi:diapolycopene oxygenase